MATKKASGTSQQQHKNSLISGISIASFLQMLEQEKHTGNVHVHSGENTGIIFFQDGSLINAESGTQTGLDAAYTIIEWQTPKISLNEFTARVKKTITEPLGYILLNAAQQQDEKTETMTAPTITYVSDDTKDNDDFQKTATILSDIPDIRYFFILNKAGKIVVHSAPNTNLGELIVYCIITSSNLRKSLKVKSPRRIIMQMKDSSSLLIIPKAGKILGMILEAHSSASEVSNRIATDLSAKIDTTS